MNKANLSIAMSIAAILLSIYAVFVCDKRIEADWMGILVGVLALLVTVLIGWNIYTVIDIKKIKDDYEKTKLSIRKEYRKESLEYKGKIDSEVTELNKNITKLEKMVSDLDIYGGNKGKWAVFEVGILYNKETAVKIIHEIRSFYENLGVSVKHIMTEEKKRFMFFNI